MRWASGISRGIQNGLAGSGLNYRFFSEYLDSIGVQQEELFEKVTQTLALKLSSRPLDALVVSDDPALQFALRERERLFKDVPIVFCGISKSQATKLSGTPGLAGIIEQVDAKGTVETALQVHPQTKYIYIVGDSTPHVRKFVREIQQQLTTLESGQEIISPRTDSVEELRETLRSLPEDSIVLYTCMLKDMSGKTYSHVESLELVAPYSNAPIYSCWDIYMGKGIVGGKLISGRDQGRAAGELAASILAGTPPEQLGHIEDIPTRIIFDYGILSRFGIERTDLPPSSTVINAPPDFFERNKKAGWLLAGATLTLSLIVFVLWLHILDKRQVEKALRQAEKDYRAIFENAVEGIFRISPDLNFLKMNPAMAAILGFDSLAAALASRRTLRDFYVIPELHDEHVRQFQTADGPTNVETQITRLDGKKVWISFRIRALRDASGTLLFYEGSAEDITEHKRNVQVSSALYELSNAVSTASDLNHLYQKIRSVISGIVDARNFYIALVNPEQDSLFFNFIQTEIRHDHLELRNISDPEVKCLTLDVIRQDRPLLLVQEEIEALERGGVTRNHGHMPKMFLCVPLKIGGSVIGAMGVMQYSEAPPYTEQDFSFLMAVSEQTALAIERKCYEERLAHQALHDELTGLPNRTLFIERLNRALNRKKRRWNYDFAVIMVDLDRFKLVNDGMGHIAGDDLLILIASRIKGCIRDVDTLSRFGGDEFVILLEELAAPLDAINVIKRMRKALGKPFEIRGINVHVSASFGIVLKTDRYSQPEEILRDADIAMYRAKTESKGHYKVFNKDMHAQTIEYLNLETDMRESMAAGNFHLAFQPIYSAGDLRLTGFETLLRWTHPKRGPIGPDVFIPIAEETGLITELGGWVLEQACSTLAQWRKTVPLAEELTLSVNLSARQLTRRSLAREVERILDRFSLPGKFLKLEVTETAFMETPERAHALLTQLRRTGIAISLDDFGKGYSSLSYLQRFPVDTLKIDRDFISGLGKDPGNREIVRATIAMAHSLNIEVVAEGVEHEDDARLLTALGCEYLQGYHFAAPLPPENALLLIEREYGSSRSFCSA